MPIPLADVYSTGTGPGLVIQAGAGSGLTVGATIPFGVTVLGGVVISSTSANLVMQQTGSSQAARIQFLQGGTYTWQFGSDFNSNGGHDFFVYDQTAGVNALYVSPAGHLGIRTTQVPAGGGAPMLLVGQAASAPTGIPAATAGFYALDVAGTAEMFVKNSAGIATQLSSHRMDGPAWLYDDWDPLPRVRYERFDVLGFERWTNESRHFALKDREWAGEDLSGLRPLERTCVAVRWLAPTVRWEDVEDAHEDRREDEIGAQELRREAAYLALANWEELPSAEKEKTPKPPPFAEKQIPLYERREKPKWVEDRLKDVPRERGGG